MSVDDGAIVEAGAVAVKDVEDFSIVRGDPAKEIRKRFIDEQVEILERINCWDHDKGRIKKHGDLFKDLD